MRFIRFVIEHVDPQSGRRRGVFQTVYDLLDGTIINDIERQQLREHLAWFEKNLAAPRRFARSRKPRAARRAIVWFKGSAVEHISRMRQLVHVLREHGVAVSELSTERIGYVVFEDPHQVAAEPFADTPT